MGFFHAQKPPPSNRSKTPLESLETLFRYGHTPHKANPSRIANAEAEWAVLNAIKRNMSAHARAHGNQNPKFQILRKFFTIQIFLQISGTRN
jgi:hypothetical protein